MPSREFATQWQEFVKTGWVTDKTSPKEAPYDLSIAQTNDDTVKIEWDARADVESGIHSFIVYRNGEKLAEITGEKSGQNPEGDLLFHNYSDTPPAEPIQMHYIDGAVQEGNTYTYQIAVVNRSGLESEKSQPHSLTIR
jgi:hypothetical protein